LDYIQTDDVASLQVGILTIGNEVLDGLVLDTNSNWIELRISALGAETKRLVSVRDTIREIGSALDFLKKSCDVIITSGGLGPTHDDMTLKAIALNLGRALVEDPKAAEIVKRQYRMLYEKGIVQTPDYTESRRKMAVIPEKSIPLDNTVGGAPGIRIDEENATIFCLPGVPKELKSIFDSSVMKWFEKTCKTKYYEKVMEFPERDESVFAPYIDHAMKAFPKVYIKSMPKTYGSSNVLRVWISARGDNLTKLQEDVSGAIEFLCKETGLEPTYVTEKGGIR
jgi:molybdenum cofactor synthesis domain-containing protein